MSTMVRKVYVLLGDPREDDRQDILLSTTEENRVYKKAREYILLHNPPSFCDPPDALPYRIIGSILPDKEFCELYIGPWLRSPTIVETIIDLNTGEGL